MFVAQLRSSLLNNMDWCEHQTFLQWTLGYRLPSIKKATMGTMLHKAIEMLAKQKLAQQNKATHFEDHVCGKLKTGELQIDKSIDLAYRFYEKQENKLTWADDDLTKVRKWVWKALEFSNGAFNPQNRKIINVEQFFEIEIPEPWAYYEYKLPTGQEFKGQLKIKGTMDLLLESPCLSCLEYLDWKSGSFGEDKNEQDLEEDVQLAVYHYALSRLYPKEDVFIMTIFYVNKNGPVSVPFSRDRLPKSEAIIREKYERIKNCQLPELVYDNPEQRWKCQKLCKFHEYSNKSSGLSWCKHINREIVELGIDKVTAKYIKPEMINVYGEGGGGQK